MMNKLKYQMVIQWSEEDNCFFLLRSECMEVCAGRYLRCRRMSIFQPYQYRKEECLK